MVKTHLVQNSLLSSQTMLKLLNLVAEIFNEFDRNLCVLFLRHSPSMYLSQNGKVKLILGNAIKYDIFSLK